MSCTVCSDFNVFCFCCGFRFPSHTHSETHTYTHPSHRQCVFRHCATQESIYPFHSFIQSYSSFYRVCCSLKVPEICVLKRLFFHFLAKKKNKKKRTFNNFVSNLFNCLFEKTAKSQSNPNLKLAHRNREFVNLNRTFKSQ